MNVRRRTRLTASADGFTLVEAVLCVLLVAVAAATAMTVVRESAKIQFRTSELSTARLLADGLMADITSLAYQDPVYITVNPGTESGETSSSKTNYDDVDDYNGWNESPPKDRDGNTLSGYTGWKRTATVEWVSPTAPAGTASSSETGLKRITVNVYHNNVLVLTRVALRANVPLMNG